VYNLLKMQAYASQMINDRLFKDTMRSLESLTSRGEYTHFDALVKLRSEYWSSHIPVLREPQARMDRAFADVQARHKQEKEMNEAEEKRAKDESDTAKKLFKAVRSELGLPPPPEAPGAKEK